MAKVFFMLLLCLFFLVTVTSVEALEINFCNPGDYRCGKDGNWRIPCADDNGDGYYEWSIYNHKFCENGCDDSVGQCIDDTPSICQDFCSPGDQRCGLDGNYIIYCDDDNGDGCYEWSVYNIDYCPDGCTNGYCSDDYEEPDERGCMDVCVRNSRRCAGPKAYISCSLDSSSGCTYWKESDDYYCEYGCVDGECMAAPQTYCQDFCQDGDRRCGGDGNYYLECGDYDSDGCCEWGGVWTECPYGCVEVNGEARCRDYEVASYDIYHFGEYKTGLPYAVDNSSYSVDSNFSTYAYYGGGSSGYIIYYVDLFDGADFFEFDFMGDCPGCAGCAPDWQYAIFSPFDYSSNSWLYDSFTPLSSIPEDSYCKTYGGPNNCTIRFNGIRGYLNASGYLRFRLVSRTCNPDYWYEVWDGSGPTLPASNCTDWCVPGTKRCGGVSGSAEYSFPCMMQENGCYGWGGGEDYCANLCNRDTGLCYQTGELPDINFCTNGSFRCGKEGKKYSIPCDDDDGNGYYEWSLYNHTYCQWGCEESTGLCREAINFCQMGEARCGGNPDFPDKVVNCGDTNHDGYYEWDASNVTYCRWGCTEDYNVNTGLHEASCNQVGGDIIDSRNAVTWVSGHFSTAFLGAGLRFFLSLLFFGVAFGVGSFLTRSPSFGAVCGLGVLGVCMAYLWIPVYVTAGLVLVCCFLLLKSFMGGESGE